MEERRQHREKKQRRLIRSPEVSVFDIPASVVTSTAPTVINVMGGGFTTPHSSLLVDTNQHQQVMYTTPEPGDYVTHTPNIVKSCANSNLTSTVDSVNSDKSDSMTKRSAASPNDMGGDLSTAKLAGDAAALTRIQNFLSRSNDNAQSFQMQQQPGGAPGPLFGIGGIRQPKGDQVYYYPVTSPNNPFLPEIIARTYQRDQPPPAPDNDRSPAYVSTSVPLRPSPSSPSPLVENSDHTAAASYQNRQQAEGNSKGLSSNSPPKDQILLTKDQHSPQPTGRNLNPFLKSPVSQSIVGYPPGDLNAKREEFLKATMKICLVVSPPSNKLQLKSKSLTHLDTLDSMVACHQEPTALAQKNRSEQLDTSQQQQQQQQQHHKSTTTTNQPLFHHPSSSSCSTCNKICCLGSISGHGASIVQLTSTIQSGFPNNPVTNSLVPAQKKKTSLMNRKKPLLTRSEVSSSEYFSVYFCIDGTVQDEELIPATKGITLGEALSEAFKKRKLNFSQITVSDYTFADLGSPPYYTSCYDENTDVESLAGMQLIVTEKDTIKKPGTLQKAASFGSRTRPPRLLSSASTEETTESEQKAIPGKQLKQRWSGLFGLKNPQQSQLCELLNFYAKKGVPQKQSPLNFDHPDFDMALEYLDNIHKSWQDFVHYEGMSENDVKIQTAIWELVTTEVDYIHALQTVTDLFLACLEAVQEEKLLTDVDQKKLFSNIRDICAANLKFWTLYIYPMVANSISTHSPLCIDYFQQGFVTFATTFAPYKKYCAEQSTCQFYCKELNRNNALFTAYLAWCESQKMCNRLRLADILVRPMQRLTKYSLLLTAIRKHIVDENDGDIMDCMIHSVENFVCSVNTHLTTRQENERLKGIMARIESYDVVDSNNEHLDKLSKQYSTMLDLCSPMKGCVNNQGRHLFMEGDLKLKDNQGKLDVHCFLLTDILLISKTVAKKSQGTLKVIRQPYLTDRLVVKHKDNTLYCVYLNEFQMVVAAFTLQCTEAKSWHDSITKAKHIYSRLKQGSSWDGYNLRYASSSSTVGADTLGIKKSPLNSSVGSRVSSLNNSHSGSVELNDSRNISVDFEKANSLSSDEGSMLSTNNVGAQKTKTMTSPHKLKTSSSNTLVVQPLSGLGQSLPNLSLHQNQVSNLYHTYSNNTLLVPGTGSSHSGNLLSPSHRGISYPPPSPTRATLRRGFAFSSSIKNPPLVKTRNITSQSSINWHQTPATPSTSPQQLSSPSSQSAQQQQQQQQQQQSTQSATNATSSLATNLQISNESDV